MFSFLHDRLDETRNKYYYNSVAPIFDLLNASKNYSDEVRFVNALLERERVKKQDDHIFDIGCATGLRTNMLHGLGWNITGVDSAREMCISATKKYPSLRVVFDNGFDVKHLKALAPDVICALRGVFIFSTSLKQLRQRLKIFREFGARMYIFDMPNVSDKKLSTRNSEGVFCAYEDVHMRITTKYEEYSHARRVTVKRTHTVFNKLTETCSYHSGVLTMRFHTPKEVRATIEPLFTIKNIWGDYQSRPFNPALSPRYITLCTL